MLLAIHKYLLVDIYDFTGKVRNVNIAKGKFRFVLVMYLLAMERSPIRDIEIKYVLKNALMDQTAMKFI